MIETLGLRFGYPGGAGLRFADVRIEQGGTLPVSYTHLTLPTSDLV